MSNIKPCSKCGCQAYADYGYFWNNKKFFFVKCGNCKIKTRDHKTIDAAVTEWNRSVDNG